MAIVYLWARLNTDRIIRFLFGIQFRAIYFPWALLALDFLSGSSLLSPFLGTFTLSKFIFSLTFRDCVCARVLHVEICRSLVS